MDNENINIEFIKIDQEKLKNLTLMDNDFFIYAANNNKELANVLIKPLMRYLGIKNYKIVSVKTEENYQNNIKHSTALDCLVELENGKYILIEIQNGNPSEMPLKRIRFEQSVFDSDFLEKGQAYKKLPDIISLIYTTDPLPNLNNGKPVADIVPYDLIGDNIVNSFGVRTVVVNGKYKGKEFENFTNVIEDLQQSEIEKIKNPVIKDIHTRTKETEGGQKMLSDFLDDRTKKYIEEIQEQNQRYQEQNQRYQEQNQKYQKQNKESEEKLRKWEELGKRYGFSIEDF